VKIELGEDLPTPPRPADFKPRQEDGMDLFFSPKNLAMWTIGILVFGQLFWWLYRYLEGGVGK